MKLPEPFIFDIETGGLDSSGKRGSSILSASYSSNRSLVQEAFAHPQSGSWLSKFSQENIIPQVSQASRTFPERDVIKQFITGLQGAPAGSPVVGFNSSNFDIPFMQQRARMHGLEGELSSALRGHRQIDVGLRTKKILGETIGAHLQQGTFREQLGGKTWSQAQTAWEKLPHSSRPVEYNMLRQMEAFGNQVERRGPSAVKDYLARGWRLEQIFPLLEPDSKLTSQAHQSSADVKMTRRLYDAIGTGEMRRVAETPEFARGWLASTVAGYKSAPSKAEKAAGEFFYPSKSERARVAWQNIPKLLRRFGAGAGILAAGLITANGLSSAFSASDDEYNTVEGLRHGGFAEVLRKQMTEFGSGYIRIAARMLQAGKVAIKGGVHETYNLTAQVAADTMKGAPLAIGATTAASAEMIHLGMTAASGGLTGGAIAGAAGTFAATKYIYAGLKNRRAIKEVAVAAAQQPQLTKKLVKTGSSNFRKQLVDFIKTGEQNELGAFISLGGGKLGRQAAIGVAESRQGFDDAFNVIEGMGHKGIAQNIRKKMTGFGSGWDALRALTKGKETFKQMTQSKGFQEALSTAKQGARLGDESAFGEAYLMKGQFRGKEFSFVRKRGEMGTEEVSTMQKFEDSFGPTVYASGSKDKQHFIDMELFEGHSAADALDQGLFKASHMSKLQQNVEHMHKKGYVHGDLHFKNVMLTKQGQVGVIDFGFAGKVNTEFNIKSFEHVPGSSVKEEVMSTVAAHGYNVRETAMDISELQRHAAKLDMPLDLNRGALAEKSVISGKVNPARQARIAARKLRRAKAQAAASEELSRSGSSGGKRSRSG